MQRPERQNRMRKQQRLFSRRPATFSGVYRLRASIARSSLRSGSFSGCASFLMTFSARNSIRTRSRSRLILSSEARLLEHSSGGVYRLMSEVLSNTDMSAGSFYAEIQASASAADIANTRLSKAVKLQQEIVLLKGAAPIQFMGLRLLLRDCCEC